MHARLHEDDGPAALVQVGRHARQQLAPPAPHLLQVVLVRLAQRHRAPAPHLEHMDGFLVQASSPAWCGRGALSSKRHHALCDGDPESTETCIESCSHEQWSSLWGHQTSVVPRQPSQCYMMQVQ